MMDFSGKGVVITGAASGIGAALAARFVAAGAKVHLSDRDAGALFSVAESLGSSATPCDVTVEAEVCKMLDAARQSLGQVDLCVSNAGVVLGQGDHAASAPDEVWQLNWQVHVMAHVYAARALLPEMLARGSGYFVNVASAAGLLNQIDNAAYSATKHAAVSFSESLAIAHGNAGIGVSVVCPQYVATPLIGLTDDDATDAKALLTADEVAEVILDGVSKGTFRILPHGEVAQFAILRATDPERWLNGMQRLQQQARDTFGQPKPGDYFKLL